MKAIDRYSRNTDTRKTQYCGNAGQKREEDAQKKNKHMYKPHESKAKRSSIV